MEGQRREEMRAVHDMIATGNHAEVPAQFRAMKRLWPDMRGLRDRISRNSVLSEGRAIMALPSVGGVQETVCLRMDLINGWLFGIDTNRVKEECRDRVLEYQRECYRVLFEHFYGKTNAKPAAEIGTDPRTDEPTAIKRSLVTEARQTFNLQAARELWFKLGLPLTPSMFDDPRQGSLFSYTAVKHDDKKAA